MCVVSAQLTIEKDELKEAQRLIRESEAKVGVLPACVALDIISRLNHVQIQVIYLLNLIAVLRNTLKLIMQLIFGLLCSLCMCVPFGIVIRF